MVRAAAKGLLKGLALPEKVKTSTGEKQSGAPVSPPPLLDPSLTSDPGAEQLHTDVPGGALEHTQDSRCPSPPALTSTSEHLNRDSPGKRVENQASKATNRKKKRHRRKSRAMKYSRRVKTKTMHKHGTRSSRKKPPRVRPA